MPNPNTQPILVTYFANRAERLVHFATGAGMFPTMPYCRSKGGRGMRPGDLKEAAAVAARYVPAKGLMDCDNCAGMVANYPSWRPNHFPLMIPDLRFI